MSRNFVILTLIGFFCAGLFPVEGAVRKPNPSTNIVWQHSFGGTSDDGAHCLRLTGDGGWVTAGFTQSTDGDIKEFAGKSDALVIKYDSAGKVAWSRVYGEGERDVAYSIALTSDGGYVFTGSTEHCTDEDAHYCGSNDLWVVRLTAGGEVLWQKCFGGNHDEVGTGIQQTSDGGFIVVGTTCSSDGEEVGTTLGETDALVLKLDVNGELVWSKRLGGIGDDVGYGVQQTTDSGYVVTGRIDVGPETLGALHGLGDVMIVRLDASGEVVWQQHYGGTDEDIGYGVTQTTDGGFAVIGCTHSSDGDVRGNHGGNDVWALKLAASGTLEFQHCYGGVDEEVGFAIHPLSDGDFIVAGQTHSVNGDLTTRNYRGADLWLLRLDGILNLRWQIPFGSRKTDVGHDVQAMPDGTFLVAGSGSPRDEIDVAAGRTGSDV
ncbi:MAG TPA: hypothetical protein PKO06_20875, partial [Candidatus Ozemobacteraceae bacterium]|nr:hypothetical protein [Candidatus Ozemobacteraceae bacterium]